MVVLSLHRREIKIYEPRLFHNPLGVWQNPKM